MQVAEEIILKCNLFCQTQDGDRGDMPRRQSGAGVGDQDASDGGRMDGAGPQLRALQEAGTHVPGQGFHTGTMKTCLW
jgi:hypothetical protein